MPALQSTHPFAPAVENLPAAQFAQLVPLALDWKRPAAQAEHVAAAAPEYWPGTQGIQTIEVPEAWPRRLLAVPALQLEQLVEPVLDWYVPAGQKTQAEAPVAVENWPPLHRRHADSFTPA